MKRILSLALAAVMAISAVPMAYATDTNDHSQGTQVVFEATATEAYTITVPALLAPGGSGTVTLAGTWADNRIVTVTADPTVTLTNSIKADDTKTLAVNFDGISEAGSNTAAQTFTQAVSVNGITDALFGTWSGKFNYNVEISNTVTLPVQNEYGFYYNAPYFKEGDNSRALVFQEDGYMINYVQNWSSVEGTAEFVEANANSYFNNYYSSGNYTYDAETNTVQIFSYTITFSDDGQTLEYNGSIYRVSGTTHYVYYGQTYSNDNGDTVVINEDGTMSFNIAGSAATVAIVDNDGWTFGFQNPASPANVRSTVYVTMYGDVLSVLTEGTHYKNTNSIFVLEK